MSLLLELEAESVRESAESYATVAWDAGLWLEIVNARRGDSQHHEKN
jgi:hypothetical protein